MASDPIIKCVKTNPLLEMLHRLCKISIGGKNAK